MFICYIYSIIIRAETKWFDGEVGITKKVAER